MSRGPYPIMLMLAMSLPGAARALGLGDIRVDSALNEPLSAQIDIVGATRDDLIALTAKVANREIFQRFGAERPAFLSSATFKVGMDAQGRPVLNIRSGEAFTDPVINFVVELRWANGALVRDYSLLLDPAGFSLASRALAAAQPAVAAEPHTSAQAAIAQPSVAPQVAATPVAATPGFAPPVSAPPVAGALEAPAETAPQLASAAQRAAGHHRVASRDTLRAIVRHAGARSETQAQRMMIAVFRANPQAFEGNINRLRDGALLSIPSEDDVQALDAADAKREYRAHMTSWRLDGRPAVPRPVAVSAVVDNPVAGNPIAGRAANAGTSTADALTGRVQSLEHELEDMHRQLDQLNTRAAAAAVEHGPIATAAAAAVEHGPIATAAAATVEHGPIATAAAATVEHGPIATAAAPSTPSMHVEVMHAPTHPESAPAVAPVSPAATPAPAMSSKFVLGSMAAALALLLPGFAFVRRRLLRNRARPTEVPRFEDPGHPVSRASDAPQPTAPQAPVYADAVAVSRPVEILKQMVPEPAAAAVNESIDRTAADQTTQSLAIDIEALEQSYLDMGVDSLGIDSVVDDTATHDTATLQTSMLETVVLDKSEVETAIHDAVADAEYTAEPTAEYKAPPTAEAEAKPDAGVIDVKKLGAGAVSSTVLDYNLLDLDATVQHVQMPSQLSEQVVVKERRTNIVDVLKAAIERDPHRRDLRMKLLETYYSSAATNQRAFLEVVRTAVHEHDFLTADDWQKVIKMGREIASGDTMFADQPKDDKLANCA